MLSSFSLISLIGVMLGVLALVVVMAVFGGLERNVKQRYLDSVPHVLLMRDGPLNRMEADEIIAKTRDFPHVEAATAYVADNVVIDAPIDQRPVDFRGIDTSDRAQMAGIEKMLDKESYPGSSADLGIDDRVIISSQVADLLKLQVGNKISLVSTRNVREVMRVFKSTEKPPVREAYAKDWKTNTEPLHASWKAAGEGFTLPLATWRALYSMLQTIYEDDIRQIERELIESIMLTLDESEIDEAAGVFRLTAAARVKIEKAIADLNATDVEKMNSEALKGLKSLVLPKEVEVMGVYRASQMAVTPALFIPLPLAQSLAGLGDSVQGISLRLEDPVEAESFKAKIGEIMGPEWQIHTWGEAYEPFFRLIGQQRVMMYFVLVFIMLVSAFSIMAVMFTITIQKRREIGVMKSLGASSGQIVRVFLYQGMILGTLGAVLGVILGRIVIYFRGDLQNVLRAFGFDPFSAQFIGFNTLPADNNPWEQGAFALAAFILCSVAAFVPAFFAARSDAAKSLRNL